MVPQLGLPAGAVQAVTMEREAWYHALFNDNTVPMLLVDLAGRVVDGNAALASLCGASQAELRSQIWQMLIDGVGDAASLGSEPVPAMLRLGSGQSVAVVLTGRALPRGESTLLLAEIRVSADGDRHGTSLIEQARRREPWLAAILEHIPSAVYIGDGAGIALCNRLCLDMLGLPELESLHTHAAELADRLQLRSLETGETIRHEDRVFTRALRGETCSGDMRVVNLRTGSEGVVHATATPIVEEGRIIGALAVMTDISARLEAEEARRKAQKMEALGRLAGGVAHEFNNIMMGILGFVHLLLQEIPAGDARRADLEAIAGLSQRAAGLTSQLLAFARRQVLRPEVFDLRTLLAEIEQMVRSMVRSDIEVEMHPGDEALPANVDRAMLEQVLTTLVMHARDAMPSGGRLRIATARQRLDAPPTATMEGAAFHPGNYASITVNDSGPGMNREKRARLFEPFTVTGEGGRGDLGLASVLGFVHQSGGFVAVDSSAGWGTTFAIFLPLHAETVDLAEGLAAAPGMSPGHEVILVAEDEAAVREVVARSLRMRGYHVLEARNGGEALHLLERREPVVDVLVTDLAMPVLSGRELAHAARGLNPDLPVVFMSAHTDTESTLRDLIEQRLPFLQKPFRPDALARVVRDLLRTRVAAAEVRVDPA